MSKKNKEVLLIDLENKVSKTNFDLVVDDEDIQKISSILSQPIQNNILYTGPSGVGKLVTLEAIAQRKQKAMENPETAADLNIPLGLVDRRFMLLDSNVLFDHDDPESIDRDIKRVLSELRGPRNNVLVIQNINGFLKHIENEQVHGIISSFMHALNQDDFQTVWLVRDERTKNNLQAVFDCHSDVRDLFSVIEKEPPSRDKILEILKSRKDYLESHFEGLTVQDESLEEIIKLTHDYPTLKLWTRAQPSRSITFLDRAASAFVTESQTRPHKLTDLEEERSVLEIKMNTEGKELNETETARKAQLDAEISQLEKEWKEKAAKLYSVKKNFSQWQLKLQNLQEDLEEKREELREQLIKNKESRGKTGKEAEPTQLELDQSKTTEMKEIEVNIRAAKDSVKKALNMMKELKRDANPELVFDRSVVREVFSDLSGIPAKDLDADESEKILNLDKNINKKVYGQDEVVETVANTIMVSKSGLKGKKRPMGVFICLGSSGVGKSYVAEVTSKNLFDSEGKLEAEDVLTTFDMSEFMEKHKVSQLIGTSQGYAGYGDGGRLTGAVRSKPYQGILLDEIEKAHPDIFKILLQVFNDGRLSDELGTVKFNNTVFFLTTNIAQHLALEKTVDPNSDEGRAAIMDALKKHGFPQEFLNRVDGFLLFNTLEPAHIKQIIKRDLREWNEQENMVEKGITVTLPEKDIDRLIVDKYKVEEGARQIQKFIQLKMGGLLAPLLLRKESAKGGVIDMRYNSEEDSFTANFVDTPAEEPKSDIAESFTQANEATPVNDTESEQKQEAPRYSEPGF